MSTPARRQTRPTARAGLEGAERPRAASPGATLIALRAFEELPYGVVVTSSGGTVIASNRAARGLLGQTLDDPAQERTCCDLLGCRRPDGPLGDACFTELALRDGTALPEMRVDLSAERRGTAVWVTSSPMGTHAILHLRAGDRGDRRRRSEPHWMVAPLLRVRALGPTQISSPESTLDGRWLRQRPGQLFKLLVVARGRVMHAEEIAQTLWPGGGRAGLVNLRHFVHAARDQLEPGRERRRPSSFIVAQQGGYMLDHTRVSVDADDFERDIRTGTRAAAAGENARAFEYLERGLELYAGDFLADEPYAEWAMTERDRLRALAEDGLRTLASLCAAADDIEGETKHMQRLAELDPFDVAVQRRVLELFLRSGRRSEAMRRFATLRQRLLTTFGEVPDFDLAELAEGGGGPGSRTA